MLKFLSLCLFIVIANAQAAKLGNYITYDDFIHFSPTQQQETIKLVHKYLIEYEQLTLKDVQKKHDKKKYHTYKKIMQFFINSAYAEELEVSSSIANDTCLYAGWPSLMYNGYCTHPNKIGSYTGALAGDKKKFFVKMAENYQVALGSGGNNQMLSVTLSKDKKEFILEGPKTCKANNDIICNPKIFGAHKGKPFCVPGNSQFGVNSSLLCSHAIDALKKKEGEEAQKAVMLGIAESAKDDPSGEFFFILRNMYESCLCSANKGVIKDQPNKSFYNGSINKRYANRIYYTRTCYGIINQTQNIYSAFNKKGSDINKVACSETKTGTESALFGKVGGPNTNHLDWSQYIAKVGEHIDEKKTLDDLSKHIDALKENKTLLDRYPSREDASKVNTNEHKNWEQMRNQHMRENVAAGVCPVGFNDDPIDPIDPVDPKGPELKIDIVDIDDDDTKKKLHVYIVFPDDFDEDKKKADFEVTLDSGEKATKEDKTDKTKPYEDYFVVELTNKKQIATVKTTVDGKELEGTKKIPASDKPVPFLSVTVVDAEGDKAKTHSIVTVKIMGPPANNDKEKDPAKFVAQTIKDEYKLNLKVVDSPDGAAVEKDKDQDDSGEFITFTATKIKEEYKVLASAQYGEPKVDDATGTIPKLEESTDAPDKKECSAEIAFMEVEKGKAPKIELKYTFDGKEYPDGDTLTPPSEEASMNIEWFDELKQEKKKEKKKTKNVIADEDENKDKDETEESEDVKAIKKDFNKVDNDDAIEMPVTSSTQKRKIGAIITFTKENKVICQASATKEIDGKDNSKKFNNGKPVSTKGNLPKARTRRRGGINIGTDGRLRGF